MAEVQSIQRYVFRPERLAGVSIFKIPQLIRGFVLVTDPFVERAKSARLTGFDFRRVGKMSAKDRKWPAGRVFELMDGSVRVWIDQEAIHLKAVEAPHGDPVELTEDQALELARVLREMAAGLA